MDSKDRIIITYLQTGLAIEKNPFRNIARKVNVAEEELLERIKSLKKAGIIRRLGVIIHHSNSGYSANAMVVWRVPAQLAKIKGTIMAGFTAVSHCYQRKTAKGWPYNLYTMIHATSKQEIGKIIKQISNRTGIREYEVLHTMKELKKMPIKL
jgi:DNA-binding Lrp family transcriptional regulator